MRIQKKKRTKNRIWLNNKYEKPNKSKRKPNKKLIPVYEKCIQCNKRVIHHHVFCDSCHNKYKKRKKRRDKNP